MATPQILGIGTTVPFAVKVQVRQDQMARAESLLTPRGYRIAMQAALSRTVTTGQARLARRIAKTLPLRIRDIKDEIIEKRPSFTNLTASLSMKRKPIPLADFKPIERKDGVSVKTRKDKPRETLKGTFLAKFASGHQAVAERVNLPGRKLTTPSQWRPTRHVKKIINGKANWTELPITERFGPTAVGVLAGAPGMLDEVTNDLKDVLEKNVASQIERVLARKGLAKLETALDRAGI